jgi:hypothetical protein
VRGVSTDILADLAFAFQSLIATSSFRCSVCVFIVVCLGSFALGQLDSGPGPIIWF